MTYDELADSVKLSEGFKDHIYKDTEGFATIGWGHKVVYEDNFEEGKTYSKEELQEVFEKDLSLQICGNACRTEILMARVWKC